MTGTDAVRLPLFPLSTVILPGGLFVLRLFEPRYLDMVSACFKREQGFGICLIRDGGEAGAPAMPYGTGTEVRIVDWAQQSDGLLGITVLGECKIRIHALSVQDDGLVIGDEVVRLPAEPAEPVGEEFAHLVDILRMVLNQLAPAIHYDAPQWNDAAWVGGRLTELLPLPPRVRQHLLEMDSPTGRLVELAQVLK